MATGVVMADDPQSPRRWFRFSLRTMFVLVTAFCCWLGWSANWLLERQQFLESTDPDRLRPWLFHLTFDTPSERLPLSLRILGAKPQVFIDMTGRSMEEAEQAAKLFPESLVYIPKDAPSVSGATHDHP